MSFRKDQLKVDEPFDFEDQELFNVNQLRLNRVQQSVLKADSIGIDTDGSVILKQGSNTVKKLVDADGKISQDSLPSTLNITVEQKEIRVSFTATHSTFTLLDILNTSALTYQISGDLNDFTFGDTLSEFYAKKNIQIYRSGLLMDKVNDVTYINNTNIRFNQEITTGEVVIIRW